MASVVIIRPAIEAAFCSAVRVTLVGSRMPNSIMPCVLPVLSLKALSLANSGESRARARAHALWYTAGVLAAFVALGALVLALRKAGLALGWGFQLQQPLVVASIALLLFALGLSLSGVWYPNVGIGARGNAWMQRHGAGGDFATGLLAVLLATPCIGPFMAPGLFVPDRDIDATPAYAVWPNKKNTKRVSDDSSMVGAHSIVGDGVPESLKFDLDQNADFMPRIALRSSGGPEDAIAVNWQPVDRARAYFLSAVGAKSEHEFVMWSSSDVAGAGMELMNYLTGSSIDKWLKQKVLLPTSATSCTVPQGIFASGTGAGARQGGMGGMGMLTMIAYGPETNIAWPPKPANPKTPWNPEWNVRVRTKSTASALLGMDMGDMQQGDDPQQPKKKRGVRGLLNGILGGG